MTDDPDSRLLHNGVVYAVAATGVTGPAGAGDALVPTPDHRVARGSDGTPADGVTIDLAGDVTPGVPEALQPLADTATRDGMAHPSNPRCITDATAGPTADVDGLQHGTGWWLPDDVTDTARKMTDDASVGTMDGELTSAYD